MKRVVFLIPLMFVACSMKPNANSVAELAGDIKVVGWKDMNKTKSCEYRDSDGDGVIDRLDRCPNTPRGLAVDHNGCPIIATLRINFDFDKWYVKKIYYPQIKRVAEAINANSEIKKIEVAGYTDNIGSREYNKKLSLKRAEAVAKVLEKYGVSKDKIVVKGYGEDYPLVPNTTDTNRALNRRVEIVNITK